MPMRNDSDAPLKHTPFEKLRRQLGARVAAPAAPAGKAREESAPAEREAGRDCAFLEAMQGVKRIAADKYERKTGGEGRPVRRAVAEPEADATASLAHLVKSGEGFVVSHTPEYMEGTGRDIPPEFTERLHRGDFSLQGCIDLHGMGVLEAREAVEAFLDGAIRSGKRAVLIVHGRGLSSPGEPVLKNKVREWLTRTSWRKWVIAFTSAQSYDGGAGATYVLLRDRRAAKKTEKKRTP